MKEIKPLFILSNSKQITDAIVTQVRNMGITSYIIESQLEEARRRMILTEMSLIIFSWNDNRNEFLQFIRMIRENVEWLNIPLFVIMENLDMKLVKLVIESGANELLQYPLNNALFRKKCEALSLRPDPFHKESEDPSKVLSYPHEKEHYSQTVLVVDDTPENIAVIQGILENDYRIKATTKSSKVMKIATTNPKPDLILLDIMMPEVDGFTLCKELKENDETRSIPIIFLSTLNHNDKITYGLELGAVDYILKPVHPAVLKARIKAHLRESSLALSNEQGEKSLLHEVHDIKSEQLLNSRQGEASLNSLLALSDSLLDFGSDINTEQYRHSLRRELYPLILAETNSSAIYKLFKQDSSYTPVPLKVSLSDVVAEIAQYEMDIANIPDYRISMICKNEEKYFVSAPVMHIMTLFSNSIRTLAAIHHFNPITISFRREELVHRIRISSAGSIQEHIKEELLKRTETFTPFKPKLCNLTSVQLLLHEQNASIKLLEEFDQVILQITFPIYTS